LANHLFDAISRPGLDPAPLIEIDGVTALTYAQMRARTAKVAAALVSFGVAPGDRVAAQIEKSVEGLLLYLGTIRAGGVFLPLNTAYTLAELDHFLADAEPKVVVCDPNRRNEIASVARDARVETLDEHGRGSLRDAVDAAAPRGSLDRGPDDLAAILYTSGTTGRSKGAMLTHANLASNALTLAEIWRFTAADRLLHALPIDHTHGLFVACNTVMVAGACMTFMARFDAAATVAALPGASVLMGVPTFYTRLLGRPDLTPDTTAHMRLFVSGSAPLPAATHRAWFARTGHAILERYGMTETNMNCSNPYDGDRRQGTVGFPLPGVALRITDPTTGAPQGREAVGMIEVKGPNVFKGYWRNPTKTAEDFRSDGFFITGDLGKVDTDGYVHIVGRGKDLVISGGFNVYPKEVELEIDAIDGVLESAVIGAPHPDLGEAIVAVVVRHDGATVKAETIEATLADKVARFKRPRRIIFVAELPRNAMGKVQKNILRETFKDIFAA
jgi:malonyl-CoA/methylmalonyl-CoA synthetase